MERTYRVRGVPLSWDKPELQSCLETNGFSSLLVESLVCEIDDRTQTATVLCTDSFQQSTINLPEYSDPLSIDDTFLGITTLYAPPPQDHRVDIIAISGLGGHAFGSFKERGGRHMWLRDSLPQMITEESTARPMARLMIYGYDSKLLESNSIQSLRDYGRAICDNFGRLASGPPRPILLIAHSLGGLIIKEALFELFKSEDTQNQRLLQAVAGIAFFGVPGQGMDIASLQNMVENNPNRLLLETIGKNSDYLVDLDNNFKTILQNRQRTKIVCFYETRESPTATQNSNNEWKMQGPPVVLVSKASATSCVPQNHLDYVCPINRTHSEMVKFPAHNDELDRVVQRLKSLSLHAQSYSNPRNQPVLSQPQRDCLRSLAFSSMDSRASDIEPAFGGTCTWILEHDTYREWVSTERGLLWIKGGPGTGKSTLLKYVFGKKDQGKESDDLVLSFFFHGRGDALQKTSLGFFRSLLHQVLAHEPERLNILVNEFQRKTEQFGTVGEKWNWHEKDLWQFFESGIGEILKFRSVWLFVDALDEAGKGSATDIIGKFRKLLSGSAGFRGLRICFGCRPYPVQDWDGGSSIEPARYNGADIEAFVESSINQYRLPNISEYIISRASGVFLWVRLMVSRVLELRLEGKSRTDIMGEVQTTPSDLKELYEKLIDRMGCDSLWLVQWLCCARRPLSIDELQWAMAIKPDCSYTSLEAYQKSEECDEFDIEIMKKRIQTLSSGLVEVLPSNEGNYVQFIHQSVREFFMREGLAALENDKPSPDAAIGRAHCVLSKTCIHYLKMKELRVISWENQSSSITGIIPSLRDKFPFFAYAALNWPIHIQQSDLRGETNEDILNLLGWPSNDIANILNTAYKNFSQNIRGTVSTTPIHIMAEHGMARLLATALQRTAQHGINIDMRDSNQETPLLIAARHGNNEAVRLLLEPGLSDVNAKTPWGRTPLICAANNRHKDVAEMLLATGKADVNLQDNRGWTPLICAANNGHKNVVEMLLATGKADVNLQDNEGWTPLIYAATYGHKDVVEMLLATGKADVNLQDNEGWTPLIYAATYGHKDVVEMLLVIGKADVNLQGNEGRTLLIYAANNGHKDVVEMLLVTGKANVNLQDNEGWTPLIYAAKYGHKDVVEMLLVIGKADVNLQDNEGWTPLIYAATYGHKDVVEMLLVTGKANVNLQDNKGWTPLICAATYGHKDVVEMLLAIGKADVNLQGNEGRTPLIYAANNGHKDVVEMLLATGKANVNLQGNKGWTPLICAANNRHNDVVEMLLATGKADVNLQDNEGWTPLIYAATYGHKDVVEMLLATGKADVNLQDNEGWTPLIYAAKYRHKDVVEMLLVTGKADVNLQDNEGRTPLIYAANNGHKDVVEMLLVTGKADVNLQGNEGWTPLIYAVYMRHEAVAELLRSYGAIF